MDKQIDSDSDANQTAYDIVQKIQKASCDGVTITSISKDDRLKKRIMREMSQTKTKERAARRSASRSRL